MQRALSSAAWEASLGCAYGRLRGGGLGAAAGLLGGGGLAPGDSRRTSHSGSSSSGHAAATAAPPSGRGMSGIAASGAGRPAPSAGDCLGSMAPAGRTTSAPASSLHARSRRVPTFASGSSQPDIVGGEDAVAALAGPAAMADHEIASDPFSPVAAELDFVSQRIIRGIKTQIPALSSAAEYFFQLGSEGKRLRPTVLLLMSSVLAGDARSARFDAARPEGEGCPTRDRQQRIAEITEMIHVASLLHDDVIDEASSRRGKKSLNALVGGKMSILAGDFLLARASVTLARIRDTEVVEVLSKVIEDLVTGEVMQLSAAPEQLTSFEFYTRKTYCKTASLFANSCRAVAMLSGSAPADADAAYEYGMHLGLAFQYVDDVLDFTGTSEGMGKDSLADLGVRPPPPIPRWGPARARAGPIGPVAAAATDPPPALRPPRRRTPAQCGTATAPVLFAAEAFPELVPLIRRRFGEEGDVEKAYECVVRSSGIKRTLDLARFHSQKATRSLDALSPSRTAEGASARRALKEIALRVLSRSS